MIKTKYGSVGGGVGGVRKCGEYEEVLEEV